MHNQRFYSWCQDLDGSFAIFYRFLDSEFCHSAKELFQFLLGGYEISQRVENDSFIAIIIGKAVVWLKYMWVTADDDGELNGLRELYIRARYSENESFTDDDIKKAKRHLNSIKAIRQKRK